MPPACPAALSNCTAFRKNKTKKPKKIFVLFLMILLLGVEATAALVTFTSVELQAAWECVWAQLAS